MNVMHIMLFMVSFQFFTALKTFLAIAITILMTQYPASITLSTLIPVNSPNVPPMKKKKKISCNNDKPLAFTKNTRT